MITVHAKAHHGGNGLMERRRMVVDAIGWQVRLQRHLWSPPTDFYETELAYVVRVEVAGMRSQDFTVTLENNFLIVRGTRTDTPERRAYQQMEIRFGEFSTAVALPGPVLDDEAVAEYEDGFLTVILPKR